MLGIRSAAGIADDQEMACDNVLAQDAPSWLQLSALVMIASRWCKLRNR
jgi:hypothetical protein